MPWVITFEAGDVSTAGIATAVYSSLGSASAKVSRALDTNDGQDVAAFVAECRAALVKTVKDVGDTNVVIDKISAVLNG